jgi:hypothetical protein
MQPLMQHIPTQRTNIHSLNRIWTCDPTNRAAADLCFRLQGHQYWPFRLHIQVKMSFVCGLQCPLYENGSIYPKRKYICIMFSSSPHFYTLFSSLRLMFHILACWFCCLYSTVVAKSIADICNLLGNAVATCSILRFHLLVLFINLTLSLIFRYTRK